MNTWLDTSSAENDVEVIPEHKPGMNQHCQGNVNRNRVSERGKGKTLTGAVCSQDGNRRAKIIIRDLGNIIY